MAQLVRVLASLTENLSLAPSPHTEQLTTAFKSCSKVTWYLQSPQAPVLMACTHVLTHRHKHTTENKNKPCGGDVRL